jgi:hypothetical protein
MKLQFPTRGAVLFSNANPERRNQVVSAPLYGSFLIDPDRKAIIGAGYGLTDAFGTTVFYKVELISMTLIGAVGEGTLIAVESAGQISHEDHMTKVSKAIDNAFEAGRAVAFQECEEAAQGALADLGDADDEFEALGSPTRVYVRFADGSVMMHHDIVAIADFEGNLVLENTEGGVVGVHPAWRSYELLLNTEEGDLIVEDQPEEAAAPSPAADEMECGCDACKNSKRLEGDELAAWMVWFDSGVKATDEPKLSERFPGKVFRYGPIGGNI